MKHPFTLLSLTLSLLLSQTLIPSSLNSVSAGTSTEWRRRTIYQLLTDRFAQPSSSQNQTLCASNTVESEVRHYCGGSFEGIIERMNYLEELVSRTLVGIDAIWISPVVKQFEEDSQYGVGWHGYWAQDLTQINSNFGTPEQLKKLVKTAQDKGIFVMVDVVANHMGPQSGQTPRTDSYVRKYIPFNRTSDYHVFCDIRNYDDQNEVEYCSIGGDLPLPENQNVANQLNSWIQSLVKTYNFDGIRIDTVKHIKKTFWDGFTKAASVFSIGEIADGNAYYVGDYQNHMDSTLGYPMYYTINDLYTNPGTSMYRMRDSLDNNRKSFKDTTVLGNFLDCHDVPRFQSKTQDQLLVRNALTFTLLSDGIPIIYQGTEQDFNGNPSVPNGGNDPWNREALWGSKYSTSKPTFKFISQINRLRHQLPDKYFTSLSVEAWIDDHIYAFMKDRALVVTSNYGSGEKVNRNITIQGNGRWKEGVKLVNVVKCEEVVTVDKNGNVPLKIDGEPKVLYPVDELKGDEKICKG
ncbi:hypothetical protein G9A89_000912 [Geosiphon pyriformis]|nr:hypothetical protein G9A89_000912 [Geosiphon pyriformis]